MHWRVAGLRRPKNIHMKICPAYESLWVGLDIHYSDADLYEYFGKVMIKRERNKRK